MFLEFTLKLCHNKSQTRNNEWIRKPQTLSTQHLRDIVLLPFEIKKKKSIKTKCPHRGSPVEMLNGGAGKGAWWCSTTITFFGVNPGSCEVNFTGRYVFDTSK